MFYKVVGIDEGRLSGAFLNSQIYKDDKAAISALISGTIKWTECHTEKMDDNT